MNRTYIRKGRGGWRVVHKSNTDNATTVIAPLSKEDAITMRDTFKSEDEEASLDLPEFEEFLKTWGEPSTHEPF